VEEISKGDNDMLSVRVARLLEARLLVLLTSTDGLCDGVNGPLVQTVHDMAKAREMAGQTSGRFSIGGMLSKLNAVEKGIAGGIEVVIANGRKPERLSDIVEGKGICTRFAVEDLQNNDE
jgi:glutamate 5-kinase